MKQCIACGMPMEKTSDFAQGDTEKDYCIHCMSSDGGMQSFEEKKENLARFIVRTQGFDTDAAVKAAVGMMRMLPAWKEYFIREEE